MWIGIDIDCKADEEVMEEKDRYARYCLFKDKKTGELKLYDALTHNFYRVRLWRIYRKELPKEKKKGKR